MDKSDTPRTDAARSKCRSLDDLYGCQPLERCARTLERELSALTSQLAEARKIAWEWGQGVDDAETAVRKLSRMFPIDAMKEPK